MGENITLEKYTCNSNELSMFIAQQRVIVLSHYPSVINYTSCEVGACVSIPFCYACPFL